MYVIDLEEQEESRALLFAGLMMFHFMNRICSQREIFPPQWGTTQDQQLNAAALALRRHRCSRKINTLWSFFSKDLLSFKWITDLTMMRNATFVINLHAFSATVTIRE